MNATTLQLLAVLNMVLSMVLPLVHSWVTNISAPERIKVLITALMAAVTGFITPFIAGTQSWTNFDWQLAVISIGSMFFGSVLSHYGLWKPLSVTGSDGAIQAIAPGGLGAPAPADVSSVGYETDPLVAQDAHLEDVPEAAPAPPVPGDVAAPALDQPAGDLPADLPVDGAVDPAAAPVGE